MDVDVVRTLEAVTSADAEGCVVDWCLARSGQVNSAGDVVVVSEQPGSGLCVLAIRRLIPPFTGVWALPGGMQEPGEALEQTSDREMQEEVGLRPESAVLRYVLGDPIESGSWDPRFVGTRIGATLYVMPPDVGVVAGDDAASACWIPVADLASGSAVIAFEQATLLERAFGPDSPLRDDDLCAAFAMLAAAARQRSRLLIARVNELRAAKGAPLLPVSAD
jgi:ADP-ribose pyrophosphatase YjhB (NUDIX family)